MQTTIVNSNNSLLSQQKASMRSSTRSENINNSDNMNNNVAEGEDDRDQGSADDIIDVTSNESSKLNNQAGNSESESTPKADTNDNDKTEKINVYEQVTSLVVQYPTSSTKILHYRLRGEKKQLRWKGKRAFNVFSQ